MNVLLLVSDEHRSDALGCAGHPAVQTPTLDRLAKGGTRFSNAYCPSPLCAPSRGCFATGRYVHENELWDNGAKYDGTQKSWGHHLTERGITPTTIGMMGWYANVDDGFPDKRLADPRAAEVDAPDRFPPKPREGARDRILDAGPVEGEAWYTTHEQRKTEEAIRFLERKAKADDEEDWILELNYSIPHFPLKVEREYFDAVAEDAIQSAIDQPPAEDHPVLDELRDYFDVRDIDETTQRRARAAYYGLIGALDSYLAEVLDALERLGLDDDTLVIYASDHGESLGDHDLWWKCCMYDPAVKIPMIIRGPGVDEGRIVEQPVSFIDLTPTITDALGVSTDPTWRGESLLPIARNERSEQLDRAVFSEYHAHGTSQGMFMIRQGMYKYVYYPSAPEQLFDLEQDPNEIDNLAQDPAYEPVRTHFEANLREIVHPDDADRRARKDQRKRLAYRERVVEAIEADPNANGAWDQ